MPYLWNTKTHEIFPPMGNLNENLLGNKNIKKKYEKNVSKSMANFERFR